MKRTVFLIASHVVAILVGFGAGIYALPILTAPPSPTVADIEAASETAQFTARFVRDLKDSDALHWGEGDVSIAANAISLMGEIAPGPDYRLYLSPEFIETETDFARVKPRMVEVGPVRTFENFIVPVPSAIDPADYTTVIVWCESFGQFITSAQYR